MIVLKDRTREEIELIASQLDPSLKGEFEKLVAEVEKGGYDRGDALFLFLSFFKKLKREAEKVGGEREKLLLKRIKKAFVYLSFEYGIKKKELAGYLKELGIKTESKREKLDNIRKAVTTADLRKKVKKPATPPETGINELALLILLIFLILYALTKILI